MAIGEALAGLLREGDLLVLRGPLGAGKTTLVKGIAQGLGCPPASSPTFVLVKEYEGRMRLRHADFFRLETTAEVEDLGVEELLAPDAITVVEWPEPLLPVAEGGYLDIAFDYGTEPSDRTLEFAVEGGAFESRRSEIVASMRAGV